MDYDEVCDLDLDKVIIGEIDLAALARAFKVISLYFSNTGTDKTENEDGNRNNERLPQLFLKYITCEGPYMIERQLAFRMVFEASLSAPAYAEAVKKIIGPLTEMENEDGEEIRHTELAPC
ncbi:hypothetical protein LJC45_05110 [Alistipes sp. OttesenSCG-928-B03]|nr:hypothetical protein [Alistipes sp. OttesenSCG-928-B03]